MLFRHRSLNFVLATSILNWLWSACGYLPLAELNSKSQRAFAIPIVKNRTAQSELAGPLTAALRHRAVTHGLEITGQRAQSKRLEVTLVAVSVEPGALTVERGNLLPVDSIWQIVAEAQLVTKSGQILDGPHSFQVHGRSYRGGNILEEDTLAKRRRAALLDNLALNIIEFFADDA